MYADLLTCSARTYRETVSLLNSYRANVELTLVARAALRIRCQILRSS